MAASWTASYQYIQGQKDRFLALAVKAVKIHAFIYVCILVFLNSMEKK